MRLQVLERTATDKYDESGAVEKQLMASLTAKVVDDENKQIGVLSLTATGLTINMSQGLGDRVNVWETNLAEAFSVLNRDV